MHYGDWEILGLAMALHGMPATVVTQASRNPFLDNYLNQCRASSGNRMLPHRGAAGQLLRLLRRGGVVAMLIDLNTRPSGGGMWLDFFGLPVLGAGAIGAIALRTGASILFATAHPLGGGRVRLELEEVSPPKRTSRDDSAIRELNQDLLRRCESVIRRDPRHWLWMYKRWKYQPSPDIQGYPFYTTKALTDIR